MRCISTGRLDRFGQAMESISATDSSSPPLMCRRNVAETKPHVVVAGEDLPAALVRQGSLDDVDLTLLSIDAARLPVRLQMRRMPLCKRPSYAGEAVVVATPEGVAPSHVLPTALIPRDLRGRFDTAIGDVATTGNSGSGVYDAGNQCPARHHQPQDFRRGSDERDWDPAPVHSVDICEILRPRRASSKVIPIPCKRKDVLPPASERPTAEIGFERLPCLACRRSFPGRRARLAAGQRRFHRTQSR